ncbi:MAG: hypothetical protein FK733_06220 [Asgard group archaeon]|nr:hypothetical protein [Asgard group archaeon]
MKLRRPLFRRLFKNQKAVSQTLAAIMMIFLFITAIAVVWAWLYPAYLNFQTTNNINGITTYMLRVDESVYDLYGDGIGSTEVIRIDPNLGRIFYEEGRNVSLQFSDAGATYNESYLFTELGRLTYLMEGRRGVILNEGEYQYMKGPRVQSYYFINGSNSEVIYQGLTNLTLSRPTERSMQMELEYRVRIYSWFDQDTNTLSITVNIIQLSIKASEFEIHNSKNVKINYNSTQAIYSDSTNVDTDFFVEGSVAAGFNPSEQALWFDKPGAVVNYDVNIEVVVSQYLFYY